MCFSSAEFWKTLDCATRALSEFWNTYNGAISTLVAGVAGPWFAFRLEAARRNREVESASFAKLNRSIGVIIEQLNVAKHLQDNVVGPTKGQRDAWLNMHAVYPNTISIVHHDSEAIARLVDYKESTLFQELNHAERSLCFVLRNIEIYSSVSLNEVAPRIVAAGLRREDQLPESQMIQIVGDILVHRQKQLVTSIAEDLDKLLDLLETLPDKLRTVILREFPKRQPMKVAITTSKNDG